MVFIAFKYANGVEITYANPKILVTRSDGSLVLGKLTSDAVIVTHFPLACNSAEDMLGEPTMETVQINVQTAHRMVLWDERCGMHDWGTDVVPDLAFVTPRTSAEEDDESGKHMSEVFRGIAYTCRSSINYEGEGVDTIV